MVYTYIELASLVKNSKDTLFHEIAEHSEITDEQKRYLDSLNDMSIEQIKTEACFLDIAGAYCDHLINRSEYLTSDNEDNILKEYLKHKTSQFETETKNKKLVSK